MSVHKARQAIHNVGQDGNWRFRALLLAGVRGSDFTSEDIARAWPKAGNKSEYRFLQGHEDREIEYEMNRTTVGEQGTERHRLLKDYAVNADNLPKHLSGSKGVKEEGSRVEARLDDAIPRMLFAAADHEEIDTLFREQLLETVMEGAERKKVARDASNVINANTRQGDMPVAQDETFADEISQGGEIRDDREDYDRISWNCSKYGKGARVTDEMRDQAQVDVIERNIQHVGASVENAINRQWLTHLIDNASGNYDAGADSASGWQALNEAVGVVDEEDFVPDTYVTHPQFRTALTNDPQLAYANRAGTNEVVQNGRDANILADVAGLDMHAASSSVTYSPDGSNTWGYDADGELGAAVYNREHVHLILYSANGEGMEIKDYDDPIRDLSGVNARMYADTDYSQQRASATIQK